MYVKNSFTLHDRFIRYLSKTHFKYSVKYSQTHTTRLIRDHCRRSCQTFALFSFFFFDTTHNCIFIIILNYLYVYTITKVNIIKSCLRIIIDFFSFPMQPAERVNGIGEQGIFIFTPTVPKRKTRVSYTSIYLTRIRCDILALDCSHVHA